ncbi:hypothetical protein D9M71_420190 [compost metagenome]
MLTGQQFGGEVAEIGVHVGDIAFEHAERMVIAGGIHRLRQVDHHRAVGAEQHVELRQVAMHQACAEHQHHLADHEGVVLARLLGGQLDVVEARCGIAVDAGHHLHQQHAVEKVVGLGHAHAGAVQAIQRGHLGVLPGLLLLLAPVLAAPGHRPRVAAVAHLAAFLVLGRLAEAALVGLLVDLGAAQLIAATHHIHGCFLAAHQRTQHLVDQAILGQWLKAFWCFHQFL